MSTEGPHEPQTGQEYPQNTHLPKDCWAKHTEDSPVQQ